MRIPTLALCLSLALLAVGCGGDDEERADTTETTPTQAAAPPPEPIETATETDGETTPDGEEGPTINRADARGAGRPAVADAADQAQPDNLHFLDVDDVTCEAPEADDPDNNNQRAAEWSCSLDSEANGIRCQGTYEVRAVGGDGSRYSGDPEVTNADISCEQT